MGRSRDRRQPVVAGQLDDHAAQAREIRAGLGNRPAHPGAHLELRAEEFGTDLAVAAIVTFAQQLVRRVLVHIA